ncbi:MAG TPA: hypothetical protein VE775_04365, partial [Pyrinomonadaceae bacterium]|nr:hypothetical protein [Pyrinomonadaceae bacterium]
VRAFLTLRDLPELRSYALLERAPSVAPVAPVPAPPEQQDDDAGIIGTIPDAGANPHVLAAQTSELHVPADGSSEPATLNREGIL